MKRVRFHAAACAVFALLAPLVPVNAQIGPDVIVGALPSTAYHGRIGDIHAYSIGTTSCNIGDMNLLWRSGTNQKPVIGQHLYRLKDGRFEHIGQSWLKHAFTALRGNLCGTCNGQGGSVLGVGCSDPYGAGLNGSQSLLGPKSDVNATTGFYPYPYTIGFNQTGNAIYKRLQVYHDDVDPAQNTGALYFIEGQYVTPDDAQWGNQDNNASYRRVEVSGSFGLTLRDSTQRTKPAIMAWKDHGLGVNVPDPDVELVSIDVTNDRRFWVAAKVSDLGGGMYRYEYAVQNLNSDRSGGSFSVPLPPRTLITNVEFHDVDYHSGEPWDNTDWLAAVGPNSISWNSPETFAENPASNAIRWGTLYNFRFDASLAPGPGQVTLGLFKPGNAGDPDELTVSLAEAVPGGGGCIGDINGDGVTDLADLGILLANFGCVGIACPGDIVPNGIVDLSDLGALLADFGCTP